MKTIMKLMLGVSLLTAALSSPAHAGTQAAPEWTDPAGDVPYLLSPGTNADWADVVGAWFEPIDGGVRVNVEALSDDSAPDEDVAFYLSWDVLAGQDEHCWASLNIYLTEGDEFGINYRNATMSYVCQGETQPFTVPVAELSFELGGMWNTPDLPVTTSGGVASVDIPFSLFTEGQTPSLYTDGTGLQITSVQSQILVDPWFLLGDTPEMCKPTYTPPFAFESGCPEDAGIYTIGG